MMMQNVNHVVFFDLEVSSEGKIKDIGALYSDGRTFHGGSLEQFCEFVRGAHFVCGHNIFNYDLPFVERSLREKGILNFGVIDTLYLSPLLFPKNPYHKLVKDDKLDPSQVSNPINDSKKAQDLFWDEVNAFNKLDDGLKHIFYLLLKNRGEFRGFFDFVGFSSNVQNPAVLIKGQFARNICSDAPVDSLVNLYPTELAYSLALLNVLSETGGIPSLTPPWVLRNFPKVQNVISLLRGKPCLSNCEYCRRQLDVFAGLEKYFGFNSFRTYGDKPLQQLAAQAALKDESFLAVFPTGGGKSITFQLPAIMAGENERALTVIISPLQSLMKDQVDNLEAKSLNYAVTINGLLDPIERAKSIERVENGSASLLYIAPESLRSKTIETLILNRKISRFVIDEAHCFSSWGQDFRVDYLYIGDFIKMIQQKKGLDHPIPVSCFTATAKQKVIEDIRDYFNDKLSLDLNRYSANVTRTNLHYDVWEKKSEEEKYFALRNLVENDLSPAIVYVSRTRRAKEIAERLCDDGFNARAFHGKMDVKEKTANQDAFKKGEVQIMVATSAFGMGVDKDDVEKVIHYDISDSLENYVQEAGRAGRSDKIEAECHILFNEEDLNRHFILLKQTKLSMKEIQQAWIAIKKMTKAKISSSALEIARKAGWEDSIDNISTRVTSAIAALEDAGYIKRGQNVPRVFATSILSKTTQEAIDKIQSSVRFDESQKENAVRVIKKLIASKSRQQVNDEVPEARIDYISDHLGIPKRDVIKIVTLLREEKILGDSKDLTALINTGMRPDRLISLVHGFLKLESFLLSELGTEVFSDINLKELNEKAQANNIPSVSVARISTILNFWASKVWVKCHRAKYSKDYLRLEKLLSQDLLEERLSKRKDLTDFIVDYLTKKAQTINHRKEEEALVEFSVHELKDAFDANLDGFFKKEVSIDDVEDVLLYLCKIDAIKIEGGFLVTYNALTIERIEKDNKIRYKQEDYKKLEQYYEGKVQQIHIVGEYAKLMMQDYQRALGFVDDYFQLNYQSFLNKYFKNRQSDIKRALTPAKFEQLFGALSPSQLSIIKDDESKNIVVAAGPGSGKTRVLVHKLASLILMEEVKHDQLLMLTFSRAAATEFKSRLIELIGNAAHFIEIKTFHSYCFDLIGRRGSLEGSESVIETATQMILNKEVEPSRITKSVLVIDEAQDMNDKEFKLVEAIMNSNEELRVIAVGDDDQNIYEFRGANSKYFAGLSEPEGSSTYELLENYRSAKNLVEFTNQIVAKRARRMKELPVSPNRLELGRIRITKHPQGNLITPLVHEVASAELSGTTCVMTIRNEDAERILGVLTESGIPAKLIQSNDGFNLCNQEEVHYFMANALQGKDVMIDDELWEQAKKKLESKYGSSTRYEVALSIIKGFEETNRKKYRSDFESFVRESKLEDFISVSSDTIIVSTIHKTKGKEFDNVFMMLPDFHLSTDEACRLLYVGLTRAKNNVHVHLNTPIFDTLNLENVEYVIDPASHAAPGVRAMHLTHRNVWLDHFMKIQHLVKDIIAGTVLRVDSTGCLDPNGRYLVRFSTQFKEEIEKLTQLGYSPAKAKVNFGVYWFKDGKEYKILLPEVTFKLNTEN
jgi:ATP-dependent DNA helicase RecQ